MLKTATRLLLPLLLLPASPAGAAGLSSDDLADLLYSNQFTFDHDGVPMVNIGLMDGQKQVQFMAPGGLVFSSDIEGGTSMATPKERVWTARVKGGKPARLRYWAVAEQIRPSVPEKVAAAVALWQARGFPEATAFELGAVFGFQGEVFDNRYSVIGVGGQETPAAAEEVARDLYARHQVPISLHEEVVRPPEGHVVVEDQQSELVIDSNRVLVAVPADHLTFRVFRVEQGQGTRWHTFRDRTYRGALILAVDRQGLLAVANQVDAERLLAGLVPAETYADAPPEALKAQAIAARGILLSKLGTRHFADPYLLCSQVHCQVYSGVEREDPRTTRAVAATRGELLFSPQGLVDTVYHACSGGHTADNETVWTNLPDPALRGRADLRSGAAVVAGPDDAATRRFLTQPPADAFAALSSRGKGHFRWKVELAAARIDELVRASHPEVGQVQDLRVTERASCGRAIRLEILGTRGRVTVHRELPIRQLLGGLKSGLFVIDVTRGPDGRPTSYLFTGGGFGHGVGMCQVGAIGRAEAGQDYRTILGHYYNGAEVRKIY